MTASKSKSKPAPASATDAPAQVTAHAGPPAPAPTLLKQASKFLNTTAGLDLTLRLFQGFVIISAKASEPVLSTRSLVASSQLDLGAHSISLTSFFPSFSPPRAWIVANRIRNNSEEISPILCPARLCPESL